MNDCNFDFSFVHPNQMSCMDVNFLSLEELQRSSFTFVYSNHDGDPSSPLSFHHFLSFIFLGFSFSIKKSFSKLHVLPHKIRCDQPFGKDSTASLPLFLHLPSSFVNMSMLVAELIGWDWMGCWKHELMNESKKNDLGMIQSGNL